MNIRFLGAAQNVTGSRHLLDINGMRILLDCGMYQERKHSSRNWDPFLVPPESIRAVCLSHAHLDHCGFLPRLVKHGFTGHIYCTAATAEIAEIILFDSAHLQEEDVKFKQKRHRKQNRKSPYPYEPLYSTADVQKTIPLFKPVSYRKPVDFGNGCCVTFFDAGHVLGSSIIRIETELKGEKRSILFTGDIGRPDRPIVCDAEVFDQADYVLIESTYGDRDHGDVIDSKSQIKDAINQAFKR